MKKDELYGKINQLSSVLGWQGHGSKVVVAKDSVLELVRHLDEPKKVVIPQFVAEWIEEHGIDRDQFEIVWIAKNYVNGITSLNLGCEKVTSWIAYNPEVFIRAWLDGYEVEREELYTVEIPNPHSTEWSTLYLAKDPNGTLVIHTWSNYTSTAYANNWKFEKNAQLTESEIKQDFEWAWQAGFAKPVEENEK